MRHIKKGVARGHFEGTCGSCLRLATANDGLLFQFRNGGGFSGDERKCAAAVLLKVSSSCTLGSHRYKIFLLRSFIKILTEDLDVGSPGHQHGIHIYGFMDAALRHFYQVSPIPLQRRDTHQSRNDKFTALSRIHMPEDINSPTSVGQLAGIPESSNLKTQTIAVMRFTNTFVPGDQAAWTSTSDKIMLGESNQNSAGHANCSRNVENIHFLTVWSYSKGNDASTLHS